MKPTRLPILPLATGVAAGCFTVLIAAQGPSNIVVPAECALREGTGATYWLSCDREMRHQLLLDARHLQDQANRSIAAFAFRQNADGRTATAGRMWVDVYLSSASRGPEAASPAFADNRGSDHVRVFSGYVDFPASAATVGPAPWQPPLVLDRPFPYRGGPLCLETVTKLAQGNDPPQPAAWFGLDAEALDPTGEAVRYGRSCVLDMVNGAPLRRMSVGSTASFTLTGHRRRGPGFGLLMLGAVQIDQPLDASGAPGCSLLTVPLFALPMAIVTDRHVAGVRLQLPIPLQPSLQGAQLHAQWAVVSNENRLGLVLSEGMRVRIGRPSGLGAAWVESANVAAPQGVVESATILPVLRLDFAGG